MENILKNKNVQFKKKNSCWEDVEDDTPISTFKYYMGVGYRIIPMYHEINGVFFTTKELNDIIKNST